MSASAKTDVGAAKAAPTSIGYGKPPKASQFQPGRSGNPSGRAKGSRNFKSDLADELAETIMVQEAGKALTLTKQRAFVKRLCAKALSGDPRAMTQLAQLTLRLLGDVNDGDQTDIAEGDQAILDRFISRKSDRGTA